MKKLNIIEASALINTEFEVIYPNGNKRKDNVFCNLSGSLEEINGGELYTYTDIINAKFIPISKPVSFMEAVKSEKLIKVEHELIRDKNFTSDELEELKECQNIDNVMYILSGNLNSKQLRRVILNGKWYIED